MTSTPCNTTNSNYRCKHKITRRRANNKNNSLNHNCCCSVYQRSKVLLSTTLFPWLLFNTITVASSVATTTNINEDYSQPKSLRGGNNNNNINTHNTQSRKLKTVQNYCGKSWTEANSSCLKPCPDGQTKWCNWDELCYSDLTSCPSMEVLEGAESGLPPPQPASLQGQLTDGKFNLAKGFATSYTTTVDSSESVIGDTTVSTQNTGYTPPYEYTPSSSTSSSTLPFQLNAVIPSSCPTTTTNTVNVGYYQSWSKYRSPNCHPITPSQIPVIEFGYTHLIYSFAGISYNGELEPYNGVQEEVRLYDEFNSLKTTNSGETMILANGSRLQTLIAVGGWNLDQTLFTKVSSSPTSRTTFANSVVTFLEEYNFDGLDLDWEYPVTRQGTPQDYDNYVLLCHAIRFAFDTAGHSSSDIHPWLLTMAIPTNPTKLEQGYNLRELSKHIDWFHIMSYDINGAWNENAGSNTDMKYISDTITDSILNQGISPEQLVFGMASYGRSMVLTSKECNTAGCPINGPGYAGCSGEQGFLPYFEIQEEYVTPGQYDSLLINKDTGSMEMILNGGDIFVSFDLDETYEIKREWYLSKCLRGQMWWAVDMIKTPPFGTTVTTTTTTQADVQEPDDVLLQQPSTTLNAPGVTQDDSLCAHTMGAEIAPTKDCMGFVFCQSGKMSGSITMCTPGLIFDANMGLCNWPSETNLCGFEFCPNKMTGYVPFEECTKFYHCNNGKIEGDIDVCPDGTLFDNEMKICNWSGMVTCNTMQPTPPPTPKVAPPVSSPLPPGLVDNPAPGLVNNPGNPVVVAGSTSNGVGNITLKPTYGTVLSSQSLSLDAAGTFAASEPVVTAAATTLTATTYDDAPLQNDQSDGVARLRFTPTDDAYVQEDEPNVNFHNCPDTMICDPRFVVVDANKRFDGLLRFYVQGIDNRHIEYVKLRLYVRDASMFGGNFYESNSEWHEDVVTWDTVPSIIGNQPLAVVNAVLVNQWIEVDVTGLVQADGPVSIRITSDSDDNVMYESKENDDGNSPELIVGVKSIDLEDIQNRGGDDVSTITNNVKIGVTDDAFVYGTMPKNNYGKNEDLKVDVNGDKKSYLRFDLSRVHPDSVQSARLRLYATDSSPSGGTFVTVTDSNWNEDTITYDDAPPADGLPLGMLESVTAGQWYELDVTQAITESVPLTICILGNHNDNVHYSSKEGGHSPEIVLTLLEAVPLSVQSSKVVELIPTDDATIVLQDPDTNFNGDSLSADAKDGMRNFLMRFDASDVPRGEVKSAVLRMYAMNQEPAFGGTFVENRRTEWNEQTVTWNTAPASDGKVLGSLMAVEYGSYYTIDVTSAVIGGSAVSFRVSSPHFNEAMYGSKESDYKPRLIVQYSPPAPIPQDMDLYIPTDDASILMDSPNDNFGRNTELKVDGYGGVFNSLLRFDLSEVEKGTVVKAMLRLYSVDGSPSGGTFVVTKNTEWSQHSVTWNTAPAADGDIIETLGEVVPYQWYEIDLALPIVQDLGGGYLSIRIAPSHGLRCAYSSSEDRLGHLPQLLLQSDMFAGIG